jgi:hypothetical protein
MTPDFDTYLMDAYDRWCECEYDTEGEYDEYDDEGDDETYESAPEVAEALRSLLGK